MAQQRAVDPAPWGWRPVLIPCLALAALVIAGNLASRLIRPSTFDGRLAWAVTANVAAQGLLATSIWFAGRDIAARYRGWGPAFGWRRPQLMDAAYASVGIGVAFVARIVVSVVANAVTHGRAAAQSQNVQLHTSSLAVAALLVFITVLVAPPIEELMFRGLLLRTFVRRIGFWPAALASSVIFGAFHTYEVNTLAGAFTLAGSVGVMGLTNCVLVRLSDRVTPGIFVHASLNGLAAMILIAQAGR